MNETLSPLNIVILPDDETTKQAVEFSKKIGRSVDTHFTLGTQKVRPHITLYQAPFPARNVPNLLKIVKGIATNTAPFSITLESMSLEYETFIFWSVKLNKDLLSLHSRVVTEVNPLREGNIPLHLKSVSLSPEDKEDVEKYGIPSIHSRYTPHVTLSRLINKDTYPAISKIIKTGKRTSFDVKCVTVCTLGDHGTVNEIIGQFELNNDRKLISNRSKPNAT